MNHRTLFVVSVILFLPASFVISEDEVILIIKAKASVLQNQPSPDTALPTETIDLSDTAQAQEGPRIFSCTPKAFEQREICVCGYYPDAASQNGLLIDGKPLGIPARPSKHVLYAQLPAGLAPGKHTIHGLESAGFPSADKAEVIVLHVIGELDSTKLFRGESTEMRLTIKGTDEILRLNIRNKTPAIITIDGGVDQVVSTAGGSNNKVERKVRGISRGNFDIQYDISGEPCPCSEEP